MFIDKVTLTNIRGFKHLELKLGRGDGKYAGWTVFTGNNGTGKSTLLKSIALGLSGRSMWALQPNYRGWLNSETNQANITLDLAASSEFSKNINIDFRRLDNINDPEISEHIFPTPLNPSSIHDPKWFFCAYGPFRRISGSAHEVDALMTTPVTERLVTLFKENSSLAEVDKWLRDLNYKRLEGKIIERATLKVMLEILNDNFLPNQITVDHVDSDGLWLKDRHGVDLSWSEMSDGHRSALSLLADILRHLINTYGTEDLTARDADGKLYIQRSGVVLIDEIDAHLHPEWQREIGFWLKRHFPNIQFLVTSHSPLICQAADPNGLFVLPEPGSDEPARALTAEEYQEVITSKSDTILRSPAFGLRNTRSDVIVEKRARFSRLKSRQRQLGTLPEAEQNELAELSFYINPDEEP